MPVQPDQFDGRFIRRREAVAQRLLDQPDEQSRAYDHVQGVQTGHGEIEREEELSVGVGGNRGTRLETEIPAGGVMLDVFVVILDRLDAQEDASKKKRGDQEKYYQL